MRTTAKRRGGSGRGSGSDKRAHPSPTHTESQPRRAAVSLPSCLPSHLYVVVGIQVVAEWSLWTSGGFDQPAAINGSRIAMDRTERSEQPRRPGSRSRLTDQFCDETVRSQ